VSLGRPRFLASGYCSVLNCCKISAATVVVWLRIHSVRLLRFVDTSDVKLFRNLVDQSDVLISIEWVTVLPRDEMLPIIDTSYLTILIVIEFTHPTISVPLIWPRLQLNVNFH
jgi:hypothetical protein